MNRYLSPALLRFSMLIGQDISDMQPFTLCAFDIPYQPIAHRHDIQIHLYLMAPISQWDTND